MLATKCSFIKAGLILEITDRAIELESTKMDERETRARSEDDVTSHAAAPNGGEISRQCRIMLKWYGKYPHGLTAREAEYKSGVSWRRRSDLSLAGYIVPTAMSRVCQFSGEGKAGRIYVITAAGLALLANL